MISGHAVACHVGAPGVLPGAGWRSYIRQDRATLSLNPQCPRSLRTCVAGMNNHIGRVAKLYGRETPAQGATARLLAELESQSPERVFDDGLPEFLSRFIRETAILATVIHDSYPSGDSQG